ncbi:potassium channel family protein [Streptomyces syringium]|uniref:potassium channel family protein n=1 Tax=Streptomyces syringium TaxID=76729 RepID=UPI0033B9BEC1
MAAQGSRVDPGRKERRRVMLRHFLRSTTEVTLLVVLYYLAPLDRAPDAGAALALAAALSLFLALVVHQVRAIARSPYPRLRALEVLVTAVPLLLLLFAAAYVLIEHGHHGSFSEALSRTDALYFTVTVFATVGFGDIVPVTRSARVVTTVQMLFDVVALGLLAKSILGAAEAGVRRRSAQDTGEPGPTGKGPTGNGAAES